MLRRIIFLLSIACTTLVHGQGVVLPYNQGVNTGTGIGQIPQFINFDGGGHPGLSLTDGIKMRRVTTGATDFADLFVSRNANYTSAGSTFVNRGIGGSCVVASTAGAYEWCGVFQLDNSAANALASQNVALAGVAQKEVGAGPTWALFGQTKDYSTDPASGVIGEEVGINADGTDANNNRLILHVVGGTLTGSAPTIHSGIVVGMQAGSGGTFDRSIMLSDLYTNGLESDGGTAGVGAFLKDTGTHAYGLMLRGTYSSGAIYLINNKGILWDNGQTIQTRWVSADNCLEDQLSQVAWWYSCNNGTVGVGTTRPPSTGTPPASLYVNTLSVTTPQFHFGIPVFLASSGTFSTTPSASGLTLTTAITSLTSFCSTTVGCYMYFPANAISGSNAAGVYFTTCTSTTVCSVFNNILSSGVPVTVSSPTSFGTVAGGGYTQTTGSQLTLVSVTIPGNAMGPNGSLVVDGQFARISNANTVIPQFVHGGSNIGSVTTTSTQWIGLHRTVHNQGATNAQFVQAGSTANDQATANAAPVADTVDTTASQTMLFRCQLSTAATDWCVLLSGDISTNYAP